MSAYIPSPQLSERNQEPIWIFLLTAKERTALFATFAGWMLDGMDVMVYSFVLPTLIATWHITKPQAGMLGTSALLISSVGGWVAGIAADRFGRVRILKLAILWFAFFTFLSGFTNTFGQLLTVRGLQGLGFGGEWAVGSVLMGESIRSRFRGKAVGTVQGGWAIGWGIAALCYTVLFSILSPAIAWRAMFWIGILPAFLVFYIRRHLPEPDVFAALDQPQKGNRARILQIFSHPLLVITVLASMVAMGAQGGYYAVTTWLPLYLKTTYHLTAIGTGGSLLVIIAGSFAGYLVSAYLTDEIGRKRTLILFAACSLSAVVLYSSVPISPSITVMLGFPLGFFASGSFSPMGSFLTELFPTSVRASGQGFTYNLGRGAGALFPTLVGYFSNHVPLGRAISFFAAIAYITMILAVLLLPETQGRELTRAVEGHAEPLGQGAHNLGIGH